MECRYAIYTDPIDTSNEPIGFVTAENMIQAHRQLGRFIKLGYTLRLIPT